MQEQQNTPTDIPTDTTEINEFEKLVRDKMNQYESDPDKLSKLIKKMFENKKVSKKTSNKKFLTSSKKKANKNIQKKSKKINRK